MGGVSSEELHVLVLYTRLSGYVASCLQELRSKGVELLVYAYPAQHNAPFDPSLFVNCGVVCNRFEFNDHEIINEATKFRPDLVLVSGWSDKGYLSICKALCRLKNPPLVVCGMDTQWKGSFRQRIAALLSPFYLKKFFNVLWVAGERQRQFARRLGFYGFGCWDGYYSCDYRKFSAKTERTSVCDRGVKKFLFVGRYVREKGVDILSEAYELYRNRVDNPWQMVCAGRGPMVSDIRAASLTDVGFVSPEDLPTLMSEVDCFVLPSLYEPWGVVLHEAVTSSLPVIATDACGSAVHLVRDGWNGHLIEAGDVHALYESMLSIHYACQDQLDDMGRNSAILAKQYTPDRWSRQIINGIDAWKMH
ncbi:glycosyltransferase family 4 protein [Coraliomargarita parva]|uniref:glycosyltransferase family 4 protein n=1 Tax=Coraliomargarita parva TaxID=3014050 RepID=UPI0022B54054|nr:glycosyltransferase family 4 protein [Coraliomargarita parva]